MEFVPFSNSNQLLSTQRYNQHKWKKEEKQHTHIPIRQNSMCVYCICICIAQRWGKNKKEMEWNGMGRAEKQKRMEKTSCGSLFPITIKNKRSKRVQFIYHLLPQPYFTKHREREIAKDSFQNTTFRAWHTIFGDLWKYALNLFVSPPFTFYCFLSRKNNRKIWNTPTRARMSSSPKGKKLRTMAFT